MRYAAVAFLISAVCVQNAKRSRSMDYFMGTNCDTEDLYNKDIFASKKTKV